MRIADSMKRPKRRTGAAPTAGEARANEESVSKCDVKQAWGGRLVLMTRDGFGATSPGDDYWSRCTCHDLEGRTLVGMRVALTGID